MDYSHIVIVVSYNDIEVTKEFIDNSETLKSIDKIIIVDNCSTNNLYEEIKSYIKCKNLTDKIECIKSQRNGGYSYGNNYGIKYAINKYSPKYISISNADVILNDKALYTCIEKLNTYSDLGFVAPTMLTPQKDKIKSYWVIPTYTMLLKRNFIVFLDLVRKLENFSFEKEDDLVFAGCLNGSFFMGKSDTFIKIDYLDEDVFLYNEESILGCKIRDANLKNAVITNETYIHNHKGSIELNISSKKGRFKLLHNSHVIYLKKYHKINQVQLLLFNLTYIIGLESYLLVYKINDILKKRRKLSE